jgi:hypothetical protein
MGADINAKDNHGRDALCVCGRACVRESLACLGACVSHACACPSLLSSLIIAAAAPAAVAAAATAATTAAAAGLLACLLLRLCSYYALRYARVLSGVKDGAAPGSNSIAEFLIAKGIVLATEGRTALHDAAAFNCPEPIRFLLQKGLDVNARDDGKRGTGPGSDEPNTAGATPLHECARHGHVESAKLLLDRDGVDVNAVDSASGATPLHLAAGRGDLDFVHLLVDEAHADLSLQDSDGRTPWRRALVHDHTKVAHFLQKSWTDMISHHSGHGIHQHHGGGGKK